jgi:hypothetical protein
MPLLYYKRLPNSFKKVAKYRKKYLALSIKQWIFLQTKKNPNSTPEEREKLNDRIERMVEQSLKKDTEFKQWMGYIACAAVGGAGLFLAAKNPILLRNVRS